MGRILTRREVLKLSDNVSVSEEEIYETMCPPVKESAFMPVEQKDQDKLRRCFIKECATSIEEKERTVCGTNNLTNRVAAWLDDEVEGNRGSIRKKKNLPQVTLKDVRSFSSQSSAHPD